MLLSEDPPGQPPHDGGKIGPHPICEIGRSQDSVPFSHPEGGSRDLRQQPPGQLAQAPFCLGPNAPRLHAQPSPGSPMAGHLCCSLSDLLSGLPASLPSPITTVRHTDSASETLTKLPIPSLPQSEPLRVLILPGPFLYCLPTHPKDLQRTNLHRKSACVSSL